MPSLRRTLAAGVSIAALTLGGCASQQLQPPAMPTVAQIETDMAAVDTVPPTQVAEFYTVGLTDVGAACGGYFNTAVINALNEAKTAGEANLLQGLVLGAVGLAGVGGPAVAGVGIAGSFVQGMLNNDLQNSLAGEDPAATASGTRAEMAALIAATQQPATAADAWADLNNIYAACSPAGIQAMKEQALSSIPSHLVVSGAQTPVAARFGAPQGLAPMPNRNVPPVVSVR